MTSRTDDIMPPEQADRLLAFAHALAEASGRAILPHFRAGIDSENKAASGFDPVTAADRAGETAIRDLIAETYPDHGIFGEEFGQQNPNARNKWVIDPIDGTRGFLAGIPLWGTLIAFCVDDRPVIGIIDQPFTGERFAGLDWNGRREATFTQGPTTRPLKTRPCADLGEAILATTSPYLFEDGPERSAYREVETRCRLARYSTDCYGYAMLAAGNVDIVIEAGLAPYDFLAHLPIIRAAGGIITSWSGDDTMGSGQILAAGSAACHEQALTIVSPAAK